MVGEFKKYDEEFSNNKGQTFKNICLLHGTPANEDWLNKKSWDDFFPGWQLEVHSRQDTLGKVYRAPGARDWQFFRVGLHGLSTNQKLWCLAWYYSQEPKDYLRRIRVENYLGALVRGGQLNAKLEIVR